MKSKTLKILVTGGAGFIGSAFVRQLLGTCSLRGIRKSFNKRPYQRYEVIVLDKLTYAGDLKRLQKGKGKYKFYRGDICKKGLIKSIFRKQRPEIIVHFAAHTHVDRSILNSTPFLKTNIQGTQILLDASRQYGIKRFLHISSDEVYGDIIKGKFTEDSPLRPSSPYAASKAAADLLVRAYIRTYNFPAIVVRPCNTYGPWQYPEKLIPLTILKILKNEKVPVYADGAHVREWLYVEDCAQGIIEILKKGRLGARYNLGSGEERKNIEVVTAILEILKANHSMIEFVKDRPGHDLRYRLDSQKLCCEIGWQPKIRFRDGIKFTASWCKSHKDWLFGKWKYIANW